METENPSERKLSAAVENRKDVMSATHPFRIDQLSARQRLGIEVIDLLVLVLFLVTRTSDDLDGFSLMRGEREIM